jgi:signal transduction histidine kinase
VVGWSLWPVRRMRAAAGALPPGERLPVPEAHDELRSLAEALNDLLARRDEAVQRLRRFTGDAAHELRSPVASIRAQAEVAVAHPDPEFAQEVLAAVTEESERMSTLVDDLLALARSDAGESQPVGRVDVSEAAIAAAERLSVNGGPRIRVDAPRAGAVVLCAPGEVALVLNNLLNNAIRYARVQVRVSVLPAGATVRLLVDDDGPGVPVEHRSRLFDRFYRVDDDRARGTGGAGLGLALVAETVRRRGGTVRVTDSPEGGARFEVRWQAAGLAMWGRI